MNLVEYYMNILNEAAKKVTPQEADRIRRERGLKAKPERLGKMGPPTKRKEAKGRVGRDAAAPRETSRDSEDVLDKPAPTNARLQRSSEALKARFAKGDETKPAFQRGSSLRRSN
jgi:hypothetical protein